MTDTAPASPTPLLSLRGLTLRMDERILVRDLHLDLLPGQRLAVVGANGSGKSTLLAALAGLGTPAAGEVIRPSDPPGMLFQDGAFWPHMTVAGHLAFVDLKHDPAWRQRLLDAFSLHALAQARPEQLSGGERLRLGLARALANKPRWVLLDEPLAALDRELAGTVRERLPDLLDELDAAAVVVTHDADDVLLFGDRLLALAGDGNWWLGSSRAALESPPTAALAALAERGTVLAARADAQGRAHFGLGLMLDELPPGEPVAAFLDEAAVRFASEARGAVAGTYMAPDRRGGSWVRVGARLIRVGQGRGPLRRGDAVNLRIEGRPRLLLGTGDR